MKKIIKKIISAAIGVIMICPLICPPINVHAATSGTCGANLKWSFDGDDTLTISGTGPMYDYEYGKAPWYDIREDVWIVNIKSGVTTIGEYAFVEGEMSTEGELNIANTVTSIGYGAFMDCQYLSYVELPTSLKTIGDYAFENCNFTDIDIPASVTSIGEDAFSGCTRLEEINVSSSNTVYSSRYGILYNKAKTNLLYCPIGITGKVTIPSGVTTISDYAFAGCKKMTGITIPNTVTAIGKSVFNRCYKLTSVTIPGSVKNIGTNLFTECETLSTVKLESGIVSIPDYMFDDCVKLTSVSIPTTVTSIGKYAFSGCETLSNLTIGSGVKTIGNYAFSGCKTLASINLPNSVTTLGDSAFYKCYKITKITIGSGLKTIGNEVFNSCSELTTFEVSSSNTAFSVQNSILFDKNKTKVISCPQTKTGSLTIPNGAITIGDNAFYNCATINSISLPNTVKTIGNKAFYGCDIAKINIPTNLTTIGIDAFNYCEGIISVNIPDSVTKIGSGAFSNCTYLSSITIGKGLSTIDAESFYSCDSLSSVVIPSNIKVIGDEAFSRCDNLLSITFSEGLQTIGEDTFYYCSSLNNIVIPYSVSAIGEYAFDRCENLTSVIIPPNVTTIGDKAFYRCSSALVIKGKTASQAEIYAKANSIAFSALASYTITYNANGGSGAPATQTKLQGVNIPISSTIPTRTEAQFKGWATVANSQTVAYKANAQYSQNANITLYAVWSTEYPSKITPSVDSIDLFVGGNERVYITIEPNFAINKTITWSSENPKVATVNDGLITGVGVGTTSIIAKTANNKQAKVNVTVVKATNDIDFSLSEVYYSTTNSNIQITIDGEKSLVKNIKWAYGSQNENYFTSSGTSVDLEKLNTLVDKNGIYTFCLTDVDDNKIVKIITVSKIVFGQAYFENTTLETENTVHIPINFEQINDNVIIYMALYDNGKLIKLQKEMCIPSENIGKSSYTSKPFKLSYPKPGYELKTFTWDQNMMPFINGITLKADDNLEAQIFEGNIYDSEKTHTFTVPETREYIIKSYTDSEQTKIALGAYLFGENGEYESDTGKTNFEIKTTLTAGVSYELIITNGNFNENGNYIVVIK